MKFAMGTRYVMTTSNGARWWGDCPQWGTDVPRGATVTTERVRGVVGDCGCCGARHAKLACPFD